MSEPLCTVWWYRSERHTALRNSYEYIDRMHYLTLSLNPVRPVIQAAGTIEETHSIDF